jgi:hypothetical protein
MEKVNRINSFISNKEKLEKFLLKINNEAEALYSDKTLSTEERKYLSFFIKETNTSFNRINDKNSFFYSFFKRSSK